MWFGCNERRFPEVTRRVHGMSMLRVFDGAPKAKWPDVPGGLKALLSIRPDPGALLDGSLDGVLTTMLRTAPAGSYLTAWHEADKGPNQNGLHASQAREIHTHMLALARKVNPAVRYGVVLTQGAGRTDLHRWAIDGLDFYAIDLYDLGENIDPGDALHHAFRQLPTGRRAVAETNSSAVTHRPEWFREIYDWLAVNDGHALLTFWNPNGSLSGPWVDDPATIYSLNRISDDAKRGHRI